MKIKFLPQSRIFQRNRSGFLQNLIQSESFRFLVEFVWRFFARKRRQIDCIFIIAMIFPMNHGHQLGRFFGGLEMIFQGSCGYIAERLGGRIESIRSNQRSIYQRGRVAILGWSHWGTVGSFWRWNYVFSVLKFCGIIFANWLRRGRRRLFFRWGRSLSLIIMRINMSLHLNFAGPICSFCQRGGRSFSQPMDDLWNFFSCHIPVAWRRNVLSL